MTADGGAPGGIALAVGAVSASDANRGILRIDPADLARIGGATGHVLAVSGRGVAHARALPLPPAQRGKGLILLDGTTRANAGISLGDTVRVTAVHAAPARKVSLTLGAAAPRLGPELLRRALSGTPVAEGDTLRLALSAGREATVRVAATEPAAGPVIIDAATVIDARRGTQGRPDPAAIRYDDLGGLGRVVERIREVVELPMRHPEAFERLGIDPPKGVLLVGPPGTGKTMIARAVAAESGATFIAVNGPEIVDRYYGASEQALRAVFSRARESAPAIVFIDEIDAIAPKRDALSGEKQVERRMVAQLLTLLDGLDGRGEVIVIAATNQADALDPALRRPGRFDREIRVDPPDSAGRLEILAVHCRTMPLAADVDLEALAAVTTGHVGADLAALCREAAMAALRRAGLHDPATPKPDTESLVVTAADFAEALTQVTPTALREVFVEIPRQSWDDVGGLSTLRETLTRAVVHPLRDPAAFARFGVRPVRGVLLAGQPGTGKTLVARALAAEAGVGFIAVRGAELLSHWQGASERALRDLFARARSVAPCILFFDEIDALAGARGSGDGATIERMVAALLTEMDGVADRGGVVVLGATNRVDRIDAALLRPGRFDLVIEMPLPDATARAEILAVHLRRMPIAADVDVAAIAAASEGLTGAELAGLCRYAALAAIAGSADAHTAQVTQADFATAREAIRRIRA
jgi:transitional endoplasmic reticulum ATPase